MKLSKEQILFTRDIGKLIEYAYSIGIYLTLGEAKRTSSQQLLYYFGKKVIEKSGKLILLKDHKRSWTKNSQHLKRLAVDFNFFLNHDGEGDPDLTYDFEEIKPLGEFWEGLDSKNKWGGFWLKADGTPGRDVPHFQRNV